MPTVCLALIIYYLTKKTILPIINALLMETTVDLQKPHRENITLILMTNLLNYQTLTSSIFAVHGIIKKNYPAF